MTQIGGGDDLLALLDRVVGRAEPDEGVEAYGVDATETTVKAHGGDVESLSSARTRGVGVRVMRRARVGYAYTADLSEAALTEALSEARANADVATPDEANVLPQPADAEPLPELYDEAFADTGPDDKVALALGLEAAARRDDRIKGVDAAQYGDGVTVAALASTTGVRGSYRRCDAFVLAAVVAEADGSTTSAYGWDLARVPGDIDVEAAAAEAVTRATRLLGGRKPSSAKLPVLLDPYAAASFLGVLAGALTAEAVQKGRSLFAGKIGEQVGPEDLALLDDGRLVDGPGAAPWDGEGVPTGRTALLEGGVLTGWLHNTYTAARDATASTGNASHSSFRSVPGISPTNLYFAPGADGQEALVRRAGDAFYCQQVLGVHSGANPVSGEFSVGAAGVMVRGGEFAEPVREATIAGTVPQMLRGVVAVGADLRFLPFGAGMGGATLLIEGMTLAGA
ncbi:MAG: TldD/PmbA family protein [Euzebyales bacterium]|nr:TldD/PmbA family protein [Euzebyales bacterium]